MPLVEILSWLRLVILLIFRPRVTSFAFSDSDSIGMSAAGLEQCPAESAHSILFLSVRKLRSDRIAVDATVVFSPVS